MTSQSAVSLVELHCEYSLLRNTDVRSESYGEHEFQYTQPSGRTAEISLSYVDSCVRVKMQGIPLSARTIARLHKPDGSDWHDFPEEMREEIGVPVGEIRKSVRDLLGLLKYHLRHIDLREDAYSVRFEQWGLDASTLRHLPVNYRITIEGSSSQPLGPRTHDAVQAALDSGALPLAAMRHLHRAMLESQPHHKWIDATIAAELAVKEVLCRAHPEIEVMLVEMPSPPLGKLYGSVLKYYLGEESPFRKKLGEGQTKRKQLVHRPGISVVDRREANEYVATVERAVFHLLSLRYPKDELIRLGRLTADA